MYNFLPFPFPSAFLFLFLFFLALLCTLAIPFDLPLQTTEGFLIFTPGGLLFQMKTLFLPLSCIESYAVTSVTSRTFDLCLTCRDGTQFEFGMIDKKHDGTVADELRTLSKRLKSCAPSPSRKSDAATNATNDDGERTMREVDATRQVDGGTIGSSSEEGEEEEEEEEEEGEESEAESDPYASDGSTFAGSSMESSSSGSDSEASVSGDGEYSE